MREIKFRAWGKVTNTMTPSPLTLDELLQYVAKIGSRPEYEYMQYTGLKDWHGNEIYEGDILKFTEKDGIRGEFVEEVNYWELRFHCWDKDVDYTDIEVIGNIYENPIK